MRIKELADLTTTTVRAIRYYHQIGLLPIPETRYGHRDYGLAHIARLSRIRWLAQAGVPLSSVARMLEVPGDLAAGSPEGGRASILTDLRAAVLALDEQIGQLQAQRRQVQRLVQAVERDAELSPMPAAVARFYDTLEQRAGPDATRRAIRRERDFMELAFYRGDMPPETAVLYEGLNDARLDESLELFGRIARRADSPPTPEEIEQIAAGVVARIHRQLGADLPRLARAIDVDVARRAADLYVRPADTHERRLEQAIADALLTTLQEARNHE